MIPEIIENMESDNIIINNILSSLESSLEAIKLLTKRIEDLESKQRERVDKNKIKIKKL